MAQLATNQIKQSGTAPTLVAAAGGGDSFVPGDKVFLHVKNADASSHTVTVAVKPTAFGQTINNLVATVPAGTERLVGPLTSDEFKDSATGLGSLTYDAVTSVTVGIFTL